MACETAQMLVDIPAARFAMGSDMAEIDRTVDEWRNDLIDVEYRPHFRSWLMKEYPDHHVAVAGFALMRIPVTNGDYAAFLAAWPRPAPMSILAGAPDDHPVWGVSWEDANAYAAWRRCCDGLAWRLPGEAEWEYAAAGPNRRRYPYGDRFDRHRGNSVESGHGGTVPAGALASGASPWGVLDLAGQVEEWVSDRYAPYPGGTAVDDDLTALHRDGYRVLRGGCFALGGDLTRTRRRHGPYVGDRFMVTGFRLAIGGDYDSA
ncbi:formylglycine-generating enzyme required for sulfatase activity [Sphingomonas trueperi]|uniref:formylglycine-generating enzyme family protein n=1 Tax=Sphingomonas trueperi TaxID=53317 RepID=UPI0033945B46